MSWIIEDWAGNVLFNAREFPTFEDAWDFIYQTFPDAEDGDFSDYYVVPKK